jgi:hypothetical protein
MKPLLTLQSSFCTKIKWNLKIGAKGRKFHDSLWILVGREER